MLDPHTSSRHSSFLLYSPTLALSFPMQEQYFSLLHTCTKLKFVCQTTDSATYMNKAKVVLSDHRLCYIYEQSWSWFVRPQTLQHTCTKLEWFVRPQTPPHTCTKLEWFVRPQTPPHTCTDSKHTFTKLKMVCGTTDSTTYMYKAEVGLSDHRLHNIHEQTPQHTCTKLKLVCQTTDSATYMNIAEVGLLDHRLRYIHVQTPQHTCTKLKLVCWTTDSTTYMYKGEVGLSDHRLCYIHVQSWSC